MDRNRARTVVICLLSFAAVVVLATSANADPIKCQRAIVKESGKFAQAKMKALSKCEEGSLKSGVGFCPDSKTAEKISGAADKLRNGIENACGGPDKDCGSLVGNDSPASIGWPGVCPNFEFSVDPDCSAAISDCDDISHCLECINDEAIDQAISLYYAQLLPSAPGSTLNKCQIAIGKNTAKFFTAKTKALGKCWDARLNGKHGNSCVPPAVGDGKYLDAISNAEQKKIAAICKACGGTDKGCDQVVNAPSGTSTPGTGGNDDFLPVMIGFESDCPNLTIPGGPACGGTIIDLADLVECVDCITEFKVDCEVPAAVPAFTPYPLECNP